jgi:endonuclease-8
VGCPLRFVGRAQALKLGWIVPEGPEIRLAADGLARAIAGRVARRVEFAFEHLRPFEPILAGEEVLRVDTRGKALLIVFANGLTIYSHNQLYGVWKTARAGVRPATRRTLRLTIENEERAALLYSASEIDVLEWANLDAHPYLAALGPDALDPATTAGAVTERLADRRFASRSLASLLLDQSFLAGIGNYLRAEICFVAGVRAERRPKDLSDVERRRVAEAALAVSRQSYATRGITNDLALATQLASDGLARSRRRFHVFARAGEPCWRCETPVQRTTLAGRRLYWCTGCQR